MRVDAELSLAVQAELRTLSLGDASDFFRQLRKVCEDPLRNSQAFHDKKISGYLLRRFSFGVGVERIAVFHYDGQTVKVIRCRLSKPRRRRSPDD